MSKWLIKWKSRMVVKCGKKYKPYASLKRHRIMNCGDDEEAKKKLRE